jgi:hypothetical protein
VATTAATVAQAQQQLGNSLSDRLSKVEQAQYAGGGKVAGIGSIGALIVGVVVVIGTIFAIISFFASGNGKVAQVQAAPQVVYVPAPAGSLLPTTPPQAAPR